MYDASIFVIGFISGMGLIMNLEIGFRIADFIIDHLKGKAMEIIFKNCIDALVLGDEISLRAAEFDVEDLDQTDQDTEFCVKVLQQNGFVFDEQTGHWSREVN